MNFDLLYLCVVVDEMLTWKKHCKKFVVLDPNILV